jgi:hypothetical protein
MYILGGIKMNVNLKREYKFNKNEIIIQEDIPIHERRILENIQLSNYHYSNNPLESDEMVLQLKGKMEIIEILRELNMISGRCYNFIQKELMDILNLL